MKKIYIILSFIIGIGFTLSSCSDYLDSDYLFDERMSIEDVFTSRAYSDKWLARAYFFLGDNHLLDVASKGYVPFCPDTILREHPVPQKHSLQIYIFRAAERDDYSASPPA